MGRRQARPAMTFDHLLPFLESEAAFEFFTQVASLLAVGQVPHDILEAIKLGRLTALQKEVCEGLSSVTSSAGSWLALWRNKSPRELKLFWLLSSTP